MPHKLISILATAVWRPGQRVGSQMLTDSGIQFKRKERGDWKILCFSRLFIWLKCWCWVVQKGLSDLESSRTYVFFWTEDAFTAFTSWKSFWDQQGCFLLHQNGKMSLYSLYIRTNKHDAQQFPPLQYIKYFFYLPELKKLSSYQTHLVQQCWSWLAAVLQGIFPSPTWKLKLGSSGWKKKALYHWAAQMALLWVAGHTGWNAQGKAPLFLKSLKFWIMPSYYIML